MWIENPADKTKCPTCLKKFANSSSRNTHVKNGCPATKPGGMGELADRTRRLEQEKLLLVERLRDQNVSLRAEAARDERLKFEGQRAELTEYRKFYDDSLKELHKKIREQREEIEKLKLTSAPGGAGGPTGGRDAAGRDIDNSTNQNIVFNIYGSEEWNPGKHEGLVDELRSMVTGLVKDGRGRELIPRVLEAGIAKMGDAPGNRTLRGYSRHLDQVGAQVAKDRWEGRSPEEVAAEYAGKISEAFDAHGERMGHMQDEALDSWTKGRGGDEVVRLATRNADRAGDERLIFEAVSI
jgi:hypothetical protein